MLQQVPNYKLDVPNPYAKMMEGMTITEVIKGREQQATALARQNETNRMMGELGPNSTPEEIFAVRSRLDPESQEALDAGFKQLSDQERQTKMGIAGQALSAIKAGKIDIAAGVLNEYATALENSGKIAEAKATKVWADLVKTSPETAFGTISVLISSIKEGRDMVESVSAIEKLAPEIGLTKAKTGETEAGTEATLGEEGRKVELQPGELAQQEADRKLTEAKVEEAIAKARNLDADTLSVINEMTSGETLTDDQIAAQEDKLGETFNRRTKDARMAEDQSYKISIAARDDTGQGDLGLIFAFMKMLDPGSVVRESEYARAAQAQGFFNAVSELGHKIQDGRFLAPGERVKFANLAKELVKNTDQYAKAQYWLTREKIESRGLNPDNVLPKDVQERYGKTPPTPGEYKDFTERTAKITAELNAINDRLSTVEADPEMWKDQDLGVLPNIIDDSTATSFEFE